jgi:hypothetical protein
MSKNINDYLKYYIGCQVDASGEKEILTGYEVGGDGMITVSTRYRGNLINYHYEHDGFDGLKLVLRKLSSMTEEEESEYTSLIDQWNFGFKRNMLGAAQSTHYLLSRGFDLWNLIDEKLAIDADTIVKESI